MVPLRRRIIGRFLVNIFRKVGDDLFQFCEGSLDGRRDRARPGGPWHWLWSTGAACVADGSSAGIRGVAETLREPFKAARCANEAGGFLIGADQQRALQRRQDADDFLPLAQPSLPRPERGRLIVGEIEILLDGREFCSGFRGKPPARAACSLPRPGQRPDAAEPAIAGSMRSAIVTGQICVKTTATTRLPNRMPMVRSRAIVMSKAGAAPWTTLRKKAKASWKPT